MRTRFLTLILLTTILVTMSVLSVSAASNYTVSTPGVLSKGTNSSVVTFSTTSVDNLLITLTQPAAFSDGDEHNVALSLSGLSGNSVTINRTSPKTVTVSLGNVEDSFALGTFTTSLYSVDSANSAENATTTLTFRNSFCEDGNLQETVDDRYLEIRSVKDRSSDKDFEWKPGDEVELEVKARFHSNDNGDSIDALIKVGLYDTKNNEFVELDNDDEDLERDMSIDEGETVTETFTLLIPIEDIEKDGSDRYKLYVKVYEDGDEDKICRDYEGDNYFQDVKIDKASYEVIIKNLQATTPVPCGEEVKVTLTAYNIGSNDEDKVKINLYNSELGINEDSKEFSLNEGESEKIVYTFMIPKDAKEKSYTLKAFASYRYKDSSETYRDESDSYEIAVKVEGNCQAEQKTLGASIDAELDSDAAIAGEQLVILGTIKNTGTEQTSYVLSVSGYDSWASLDKIDSRIITLDAGKSQDFNVYFNVNDDASGEKTFTIIADFGDTSEEQDVSVFVEKQGVSLTGAAIAEHLRNNWFIWVIVVINVILIIAIIVVARRIVSSR